MLAYIQTKSKRADGSYDCYLTREVDVKISEYIPRKGQTQSGYGRALPTHYLVKLREAGAQWQRVKCICFSNCGTLYVGNTYSECLVINIERE